MGTVVRARPGYGSVSPWLTWRPAGAPAQWGQRDEVAELLASRVGPPGIERAGRHRVSGAGGAGRSASARTMPWQEPLAALLPPNGNAARWSSWPVIGNLSARTGRRNRASGSRSHGGSNVRIRGNTRKGKGAAGRFNSW